jgi:beta-glucosidase
MRRTITACLVAAASLLLLTQLSPVRRAAAQKSAQFAYLDPRLPVEQRVADLLSRMTLEEKVAQLESVWVTNQSKQLLDERGEFAPDQKMQELFKNGIGQFGGPSQAASDAEKASSPLHGKDARAEALFTNSIQKYVIEHNRLRIPATFHEEALHGLMAPGATSFPQAIALASTWDTDLVHEVFTAAAAEARTRGATQVLAPDLDLGREPRWGRIEETYGEDPYLVSRMGVAAITGFQGAGPTVDNRHVIATAKHFAAHGQPEGGTNIAPANYSERILREDFFYPFEVAVKEAHVMSVMPSYNEIDGVPSHANRWLIQKVLREEWGFDGYASSDYFGVAELIRRHHVAANEADAALRAINTGVDMELPYIECYNTLVQQVRDGRVPEALIDKAASRILRGKFLLGLFENPYVDPDVAARTNESAEHRALALKAAREAIVLLKNEGNLVPLDRTKIRSIAVVGPNAARADLGEYSGTPSRTVSLLDGIKAKVGGSAQVNYAEGVKITKGDPKTGIPTWGNDDVRLADPAENARGIVEAVKVARASDVVVLAVGGNVETSREEWAENHLGDRDDLDLVGQQNDLVKAILETGKPTIVFFTNGRPLSANYVYEHVPAVFEGWYLGEETGTAAADVLFGDYNPSGKMPVTVARNVGQLPVYYYQKPSAKRGFLFTSISPLFVFGHGLSYTTYNYSNLRITPDKTGPAEQATVTVDVTNAGRMAGDEIVQLYIRDDVSSVTRPVKELKDFRRIHLEPGQMQTVRFTVTPDKLSFLNEDMRRVVEPGTFTIMVGPSSATEKELTAKLEVVAR